MSDPVEDRASAGPIVERLLDAVEDPAFVCDASGGIVTGNEEFAAAIGASADGVADRSFADVVACDDDPIANAVRTGEVARASGRLVGGPACTVVCRPVERDGAVGRVVVECPVAVDDPETEDWEEVHLAGLLSDLPVVVVGVDADGVVEYCRGLEFDSLDCERADVVGAPVERFAGVSGELVGWTDSALDGETVGGRATLGDRSFQVRLAPLESDGTVVGAVAVAVEITDRERRERELEATQVRLDLALEATGAGVYEWEIGENRVYWHETTSELFGLDTDTTYRTRETFGERVHSDDRDRVREYLVSAVEDGEREVRTEYRVVRPDGELRWMVTEGKVQYADGEPDRLTGLVRDVTERKERERDLETREGKLRAVIESSPDPISMQDPDGRYQLINEAMVERTETDRATLHGATPADVFAAPVARRLEHHREAVLETERAMVAEEQFPSTDGDSTVQLTMAPYYGPEGDVRGTVTIARDVTELERQRDELETLTEIQALVQESVRALAAATTREEIKRTVCERLADSQFYELAWIGERAPSSREVEPSCVAGDADDYLEAVTVTVDPADSGRGPGGTAYRSGDVQVVHDVAEDPDFEPWRDAALDRGFRSLAAIPLTHGSTTHGILSVYANEANAFSKRELAGFKALGDVVGFALSAAQYRRLLEAETVLELEFEVRSDRAPFIVASGEHDCRFVIDHAAHTTEDCVIDYLTVEDADPELGRTVANRLSAVEEIRELGHEDGPHYEMTVRDSVFQYLANAGARGDRGVIEDGVGHLYVEAPGDIDVRTVTKAVERRFSRVDLSAKREKHRTDSPWWHPSGDLGAQLTDRQRSVLRTAFYSGYYEWPRETDAETLADSLDVASSTVLQHLRKGHHHVLETLFES